MSQDDRSATARETPLDDGGDAFSRWRRETGHALETADNARVEVYVRSLLPPPGAKDAQRQVMRDLEAAAEDSAVNDVIVDVWGERLCLCEDCRATEPGRVLLNRVGDLEAWGDEYDASAAPFFERTSQSSSLTGGSYEGIAPPRVTAVLYVDKTVHGVFPARFGDDRYSVSDFASALQGIETGQKPVESRQ